MPPSVYVSAPNGHELPEALLKSAVVSVLEYEGIDDAEVSLTFLPDDPIRELNLRWRGHDWVPDVIAFGLHDPGEIPVGDIYIAVEQAARHALEHGVTNREELVRLVIHGTLHVLGYDHPEAWNDRLESDLYRRQEEIVLRVLEGPGRPSGTEIVG